ncbi:MAG: DUF1640 domain-containing protein [Rhodocyclales bacterium]|nr:DUF1640 domain-containing protein [Rhodocyclales bacterium]
MGAALKLYEELLDAGEDKRRAKLIAEAFEALEARYPDLRDIATHAHLRESELRLQREIEAIRLEIKEVEANLRKELADTRLEIKNVEVRLTQAIHRQTVWVILAIGGITGFIRWLDVFFK